MKGERAYNAVVQTMAAVFIVIGVVILVLTISYGGGPVSTGIIIGLAFIGIGIARFVIQSKMSKGGR